MSKQNITELEALINSATDDLPKVTSKKMFDCHALWADGNVFALVWKRGRIGLKLPREADYETLMKASGAEPWKTGPMKMAHWVLVPESFHSKPAELKKWTKKAHDLCSKLDKKEKTSSKSKVQKKTAKKKAI